MIVDRRDGSPSFLPALSHRRTSPLPTFPTAHWQGDASPWLQTPVPPEVCFKNPALPAGRTGGGTSLIRCRGDLASPARGSRGSVRNASLTLVSRFADNAVHWETLARSRTHTPSSDARRCLGRGHALTSPPLLASPGKLDAASSHKHAKHCAAFPAVPEAYYARLRTVQAAVHVSLSLLR